MQQKRYKIWLWTEITRRLSEEIKRDEKFKGLHGRAVRGSAPKRESFTHGFVEESTDDRESTVLRKDLAPLNPLGAKRFLFSSQCSRTRQDWLKVRTAGRAYDALEDLCTTLGGGGDSSFDTSRFGRSVKFILSACQGEVCIFITPSHRYFKINNFNF